MFILSVSHSHWTTFSPVLLSFQECAPVCFLSEKPSLLCEVPFSMVSLLDSMDVRSMLPDRLVLYIFTQHFIFF